MLANAMIAAATTSDLSEYAEYIDFFQQYILRAFFVSGTQLAYLFIDHQFVSLDHNKKENEEKYFFTNNLIVVFLLLSRK